MKIFEKTPILLHYCYLISDKDTTQRAIALALINILTLLTLQICLI